MKISKSAAVLLAIVLVIKGIPFVENVSYANVEHIEKKATVMNIQQESIEGISTLQYQQADGD